MGTGALVDTSLIPSSSKNPFGSPNAGPQAIFVALKPGIGRAGAVNTLQKIASELFPNDQIGAQVLDVQRPAEIVNYRSMGTTLRRLGTGLSAGALIALGLTLVASVRRRRREFALLKALGFTNRQLAAVVAWHASTAAVCGIVVGMPLGIIGGRQLWLLFAHSIHAVPVPTVPMPAVAVAAAGGLLLANLIAIIPGRAAARVSAASVLRSDV
jgi:putative ABC transport system permease protein